MRGFTRYIDRLVRRRRPDRFAATPDEAAAVRAAIALSAADDEDQVPRPEFVSGLRDRLAAAVETPPAPRGGSAGVRVVLPSAGPGAVVALPLAPRRGLLIGTSAAAAAAVVAVVADRNLGGRERPAALDPGTLAPEDGGAWHTVLASTDLPGNGAAPFDTSVVSGFVMRIGGVLSARSAVCTHQGCKLGLNAPQQRLACPCHRTFFAYDGTVIHSQLSTPPPPLPQFQVRELDGQIQVLLPKSA